jgi:hypothetical protein
MYMIDFAKLQTSVVVSFTLSPVFWSIKTTMMQKLA